MPYYKKKKEQSKVKYIKYITNKNQMLLKCFIIMFMRGLFAGVINVDVGIIITPKNNSRAKRISALLLFTIFNLMKILHVQH